MTRVNEYGMRLLVDAIGAALRENVRLELAPGCCPAVRREGDAIVMQLPDHAHYSRDGFANVAGDALHEFSHVKFRSLDDLGRLLEQYPPALRGLARDCYNWVIDVSDETRFERVFAYAADLFKLGHRTALERAIDGGRFPRRAPRPAHDPHQLLCAAFLWVRSDSGSPVRALLRGWTRTPGMAAARYLLWRARESGVPQPQGDRTPGQWQRLHDVTRRLMDLVRNLFPDAAGADTDGAQGDASRSRAGGQGGAAGRPGPRTQAAPGDSTGATSAADLAVPDDTAGAASGQSAQGGPAQDQATPSDAAGGGSAGGMAVMWRESVAADVADARAAQARGDKVVVVPLDQLFPKATVPVGRGRLMYGAAAGGGGQDFDAMLYAELAPVFRREAHLLVQSSQRSVEDRLTQGPRLGRVERAPLDGRIFRRYAIQEAPGATLAIVVDHSSSTRRILGRLSAAAAALAEAFREIDEVRTRVWRYGTRVEVVSVDALKRPALMGGTATHRALQEAVRWARASSDQVKRVALFTDGMPDDAAAAGRACEEAHALGIDVLVGAVGADAARCKSVFPRASVFEIDPRWVTASFRRMLERMC